MDPNKDNEMVYLVNSVVQPVPNVFDSIMSKMDVDISTQNIGYRLSDQKESIWTRIHNVGDFSCAVEAQHDIQSCAFKSKWLHIINKVSNNLVFILFSSDLLC